MDFRGLPVRSRSVRDTPRMSTVCYKFYCPLLTQLSYPTGIIVCASAKLILPGTERPIPLWSSFISGIDFNWSYQLPVNSVDWTPHRRCTPATRRDMGDGIQRFGIQLDYFVIFVFFKVEISGFLMGRAIIAQISCTNSHPHPGEILKVPRTWYDPKCSNHQITTNAPTRVILWRCVERIGVSTTLDPRHGPADLFKAREWHVTNRGHSFN